MVYIKSLLSVFTNNIWPYLLWSPVIIVDGGKEVLNPSRGKTEGVYGSGKEGKKSLLCDCGSTL